MPNPFIVLRQAVKAVPAVRYALGVAGLVAVVAIVRLFGVNPVNAVFGSVIMLFLMAALVIFAKLTTLRAGPFRLPATILMWSALVLLIATACFLFTSTFFNWPLEMRPTTPAGILRAETRYVGLIKLGADEKFITANLGVPARSGFVDGFRQYDFDFMHFSAHVLFDDNKKVMQYAVTLKTDELHVAFDEPEPATGRKLELGKEPFGAYRMDRFRPVHMEPLASDAEPFFYFELLDGEPGTDVAVRLEFIAPRIKFPETEAESDHLDSVSDTLKGLGCHYGPNARGRWPFSPAETKALKAWRAAVVPNSITVQRRLSELEAERLNQRPGQELCPPIEDEEPEEVPPTSSIAAPEIPPIKLIGTPKPSSRAQ